MASTTSQTVVLVSEHYTLANATASLTTALTHSPATATSYSSWTLRFAGRSQTLDLLAHLARGCQLLRVLLLQSCTAITDTGLGQLATTCRGLQSLDLGFCNQITNVAIDKLADQCQELHTLNLTSCTQLTA